MKKVISLAGFTLFLFVLSTNRIIAACDPRTQQASCGGSRIICAVSTSEYCCDTYDDCVQIRQDAGTYVPPSTSTPNSSNSVVTCDNDTGISTAIGCIHALGTQSQFLGEILRWAVGIGGGVAFLLMIYAGFMIMTSAGNPERLKAGQELLTSAISGLILLIFSVFILRFIGIDILGLNDFGFGG